MQTNSPSRRNFRLGVINGLAFTATDTMMDPTLVIAAFISHLTASPIWIGLIVPFNDGGWYLPQFWISGYLQSQPRKLVLYRLMAVIRTAIWIALVAIVYFVHQPQWLLVLFVIFFALLSLGSGFSGLSFLEIVGKTIPPNQRGLFFAWRLILGGIAGIASSVLVRWMLDDHNPLAFPYNFGALFSLALACGVWGLAAFSRTDEPPDANVLPRVSAAGQLRRAVAILRTDSNYRHFLALRTAMIVAGAATPFFAVYVHQALGGSLAMVGVYLAVLRTVGLLATVVFGRLSLTWGNHRLMIIAAGAGLIMTLSVLALVWLARPLNLGGAAASLWLLPVFAIAGVREAGLGVAAQSQLLDIAPPAERTLYLGFTNSFLGVMLLVTGLSGVVVQTLGFTELLVVTLAAHLFALYASRRVRSSDDPLQQIVAA